MKINKIIKYLSKPVDAAPLGLFRILFGLLMMYEVYRYYIYERIERYYIEPKIFFSFIEGLPIFSGEIIYLIFILMFISAFLLTIGFKYKFASITFFVLYTYIFLIDKAQYNNHYYFISLLAFLFCVTNANRFLSIDKIKTNQIPQWENLIFKFQVFVVFFFAGIAKINKDWLIGEPIRHWLYDRQDFFLIGQYFTQEWFVYLYAYGGLFFDFFIGFLLLYRRTLFLAFPLLLMFNFMNKWFYNIGIFPYLATAVFVLFLNPQSTKNWFKKRLKFIKNKPLKNYKMHWLVFVFIILYVLIQIFLPLRHFFILGNVSWTEEGHDFSWHMKLRDKDLENIEFFTIKNGTEIEIPITGLTDRQKAKMSKRPHMIIQYAHYLSNVYENVHVRSIVSLNHLRKGFLINESFDLSKEKYKRFSHNDWILFEPDNK